MNNRGQTNLRNSAWKKVARLKMLPLLNDIFTRIEGLAENRTKEKFVLYSGHDTTVSALLMALGISDGTWNPYATRVVFETYGFRHAGHKHYLLRVVVNGEDLTAKVIFCRGEENEARLNDDGMCSFEDFENFIRYDSLKDIDEDKTYAELCNPR